MSREAILHALSTQPMSTMAISNLTGIPRSKVADHVKRLRPQLTIVGRRHTGAIYALKRSESVAESGGDADGRCDTPSVCGGIRGMSNYLCGRSGAEQGAVK